MPIRKEDVFDLDFVDAAELSSDSTSVYRSGVSITSTTSGTNTIVVTTPGLITLLDNPLEISDIVTITGTSSGLGDGTFVVATIIDDSSFTVTTAIGTSTGGTAEFKYSAGATKIGVDNSKAPFIATNKLQTNIDNLYYNDLLEEDPTLPNVTYSNTMVNGLVTQEKWINSISLNNIKTIDYTYSTNKVIGIVTKVYATNGSTILAQTTKTVSYNQNVVSNITTVRNI